MSRRYALLGHPVAHSRSPALHNHWFARSGLDATYEARDIDPARADDIARIFRDSDLDGANLTVPFKTAVVPHLDRITPLARAAGSVNTLWREGGSLHGDSTDGPGFLQALRATGPLHPDRPAVILGVGGAGRAIAAALAQAGWTELALLNRTPQRADDAATQLSAHFHDCRFTAGPLSAFDPRSTALVAMCVSGPGREAIRALPIDGLPADARWCDLNYWDHAPPHRDALNDRFDDGSSMLTHQAALAFARWTGITPDPSDLPDEPA